MVRKAVACLFVLFALALFSVPRAQCQEAAFDWETVLPGTFKTAAGGPAGGIYLYGDAVDGSAVVLAKVDAGGNVLWSRSFTPSWPSPGDAILCAGALTVDSAGNAYITIRMDSDRWGKVYNVIAKYDSRGRRLWAKRRVTDRSEMVEAITTDHSGNLYVAGMSTTFDLGEEQSYLVKYLGDGTLSWTRFFGADEVTDLALGVAVDGEDNVVVGGATLNWDNNKTSAFLLKYTPDGQHLWTNRLPIGRNSIPFFPLIFDSSNSVYTALTFPSQSSGPQITLFKFDSAGNLEMKQPFSGPENTQTHVVTMQRDGAGNFIILGREHLTAEGLTEMYLLKVTPEGAAKWTRTYGIRSNGLCFYPDGLALGKEDDIFVTGIFRMSPSHDSANRSEPRIPFLVKYATNGKRLFVRNIEEASSYSDGEGNVYLVWTSGDGDMVVGKNPQ